MALISDDVDWPDGDAGRLHGKDEVRAYWTEQWARTRTHDAPVGFSERSDGRTAVHISQVVRSLDGPARCSLAPKSPTTEVLMMTTSLLPDVGTELREGYAQIGDQSLHYVEAGEGPLIVLLHGFPEFWFGWRLQIEPLVAAGFRVVAPDTRGYNLSSKPEDFEAYAVDLLAADIRGLIGELGAESALLVGHDWGGSIAWTTGMNHPEVVDRLAILNAAHPRRL
ncbi:MAG TPA: alpha/beta fold hydrolase, partial [Candidatus Limnocylindrales bacterium]